MKQVIILIVTLIIVISILLWKFYFHFPDATKDAFVERTKSMEKRVILIEEMNEEQNINGEDPKENDEDNIINNDEEEQVVDQGEEQGEEQLEGQVEEEIVLPSNELNKEIFLFLICSSFKDFF